MSFISALVSLLTADDTLAAVRSLAPVSSESLDFVVASSWPGQAPTAERYTAS